MLSFLNQRLIAFAKASAQPVRCEACGNTFKPFADQEVSSLGDMMGGATCPQCGKEVQLAGARAAKREDDLAPKGPLPQPAGSRIERHDVSASERLYHIPATGKGGFLLTFAIFWNCLFLCFGLIYLFAVEVEPNSEPNWPFALFMVPFVAVGLGVGYAGLRAKYAVHLLFVGPEFMRLQRQLFGRKKNYDLPTQEVTSAEQKEFYQQNYQPVYGIEIAAGRKKIRFGTALAEEERRWLCAELREYLRSTGISNFPSDSPPTPSQEQ